MSQGVSPQITISPKNFSATIAFVRFMIGMGKQVGFQVGSLVERPGADLAFVRRLFHMEDLVHGQGPGLAESFAALVAFERFFLRMDVSVTEIKSVTPLVSGNA